MRTQCVTILVAAFVFAASAVEVTVDPKSVVGDVKPVNGVNNMPMMGFNYAMFRYLEEAEVPFCRLHDTGGPYGGNRYVDIPNVFRNFDADENDPASYDFAHTDLLLAEMQKRGLKPLYRLGVTIDHSPVKKYFVDPPKDFAKWARICEHVILHYNEGWANGFRYGIKYWEIWNEPDATPFPDRSVMWRGTWQQFEEFYATAARHLKAKFPHLKIGGYGASSVVAALGWNDSYGTNLKYHYHLACFKRFVEFVRDSRGTVPVDFFSFHTYSGINKATEGCEGILAQVEYVRKTWADAGFPDMEIILDEWMPRPDHKRLGTAEQASEIAASLALMQNSTLDAAALYEATVGLSKYSPLFSPLTREPHRAYYAFTAFRDLRRLGKAVKVSDDGVHGRAVAASDGSRFAVLVTNFSDKEESLRLNVLGGKVEKCRLTDEGHIDEEVALPAALPPYSFVIASGSL